MLISIILFTLIFLILGITSIYIGSSSGSELVGGLCIIIGVILLTATVMFPITGGFGGEFGYNTYKEIITTNFSKALLSDHSAVVINYADKPYIFTQFNIVHNYSSISNIIICERRSAFGNQMEFNIKIVTPSYQEE